MNIHEDFIKKAKKAQYYADNHGLAYVKALSACPLNWNDPPRHEREVIAKAVESCYHPLFEIENGRTRITYKPKEKIGVIEFLSAMGRTKHLAKDEYKYIVDDIQAEVDRRWENLLRESE